MALIGDPRLPQAARTRMETADRLGKWPEMSPHVADLESQARQDGYELIPLSAPAALQAALLDWDHRDPFDRVIAAIARLEGLPVISSDAAFDRLGLPRQWDQPDQPAA